MAKTLVSIIHRPVFPTPAGLIVSIDKNKKPNVMTAGEIFNIGLRNPTIIGIALRKATYTHGLITESRQFTANMTTASIIDIVDIVGTVSGRDGLDKFKEFGLTPLPSSMIDAPIVEECPVNMECKLLSVSEVGDHDLFLGHVVAMHVDSDKLDDNGRVDIDKIDGLLFAEWSYFAFGKKLGVRGYSKSKYFPAG